MEDTRLAPAPQAHSGSQETPKLPFVNRLFRGPNGFRAGLRVLAFFVVLVSSYWLLILVIRELLSLIHFPHSAVLTPGRAILNETVIMVALFITTAIFARTERRSF